MPASLSGHFAARWVRHASARRPEGILFPTSAAAQIVFAPRDIWFVGPLTAPKTLMLNAPQLIGYRFTLGTAARSFGVPARSILDVTTPIDRLLDPNAMSSTSLVSGDADAAFATTALQLEALFKQRALLPETWRAVLNDFEYAPLDEAKLIAVIRTRYGISERTARRYVSATFGFGAKALERILRFNHFCALMGHPTMTLTAAAYLCGYADSAHLARDARALSTLSPSEIREQLRDDRTSLLAC